MERSVAKDETSKKATLVRKKHTVDATRELLVFQCSPVCAGVSYKPL
jgi:hypothetical protein